MLRRWIIRTLALAVLTLCVTVWVGSYFQTVNVLYVTKTYGWHFFLAAGEIEEFDCGHGPLAQSAWEVIHQRYVTSVRAGIKARYERHTYHLLGFAWQPFTAAEPMQRTMIPLWFPTILSAGCLWLVWRKTRPKYSGKGFPVEVAGGGGKEATKA